MHTRLQATTVGWLRIRKIGAMFLLMLAPILQAHAAPQIQELVLIGSDSLNRNVNVFVDGRYNGTLRPGEFSRVPYCSNQEYAVTLSFGESNSAPVASRIAVGGGQALSPAYEVHLNDTGFVTLLALPDVPTLAAFQADNSIRKVVSRFLRGDCVDVAEAPPAVVPVAAEIRTITTEKLTWHGPGATFAFGKSVPLQQGGKNDTSVQLIADQIQSRFQDIVRIRVRGHSDFEGSPSRKMIRATERAQYVATELRRRDLKVAPADVTSASDAEPIVTNCRELQGAELKACNAPNRRVEVTVEGIPR